MNPQEHTERAEALEKPAGAPDSIEAGGPGGEGNAVQSPTGMARTAAGDARAAPPDEALYGPAPDQQAMAPAAAPEAPRHPPAAADAPPAFEAPPAAPAPEAPSEARPVLAEPQPEPAPEPAAAEPAGPPAGAPDPGADSGDKLTVGRGIRLIAKLCECAELLVEGHLEATAQVRHLAVAEGGRFIGSAEADSAEVHGHFEGDLTVARRLFISATGSVAGTTRYQEIVIEAGGQVMGNTQRLPADGANGANGAAA